MSTEPVQAGEPTTALLNFYQVSLRYAMGLQWVEKTFANHMIASNKHISKD